MSNLPTLQYSNIDYETIEAAVVETERGRWFLREYQRRNRHADTQQVLSAIERMQASLAETVSDHISQTIAERKTIDKPVDRSLDVLRQDLIEMALRIAETHTEVAAIGSRDENPKHFDLVSGELDAIVRSTEQATSEILESAEQIQEIAWTLREGGLAVETCDAIDARSTNIYLACSFQDLTAQRATKVIETMRFLENRINKMIGILQGVEGFRISDLTPETSEPAGLSALDEADRTLQQNDIDFALQWESEQDGEASGPFADPFATLVQEHEKTEEAEEPSDFFSDEGIVAAAVAEAPVRAEEPGADESKPEEREMGELKSGAIEPDELKPEEMKAGESKPGESATGDAYLGEEEIAGSLDALPEPKAATVLRFADAAPIIPPSEEKITGYATLDALDGADIGRKLSLFT